MVKSCWNIIYANAPVAAIYRTDTSPGIVVKVDLTWAPILPPLLEWAPWTKRASALLVWPTYVFRLRRLLTGQ